MGPRKLQKTPPLTSNPPGNILGGIMSNYCEKNGYPSRRRAEAVRNSVYKQRKARLRIYECPKCHLWHLTSQIGEIIVHGS